MSGLDPDYAYVPSGRDGIRPANRVVLEHFEHGAVYAVPKNTTLSYGMMRRLRATKDEAYEDARLQGAGAPLIPQPARIVSVTVHAEEP